MNKRERRREKESVVNGREEEEEEEYENEKYNNDSKVTTLKTHLNERQFILKSLEPNVDSEESKNMNIRVDGRQIYDFRPIRLGFDPDQMGHVWCRLGNTQVMAHVICNITEPYAERPTEGFLTFQIELHASLFDRNNKAYPAALQSRNAPTEQSRENLQEMSIEWSRVIERSLRGSRAIDTEALCLVAGEKVWSLKVVLNVIDMDGNVLDCAHIAAITALLHFKRPEVTIEGQNIIIHSITEREPVPLSVHHIPICVTFAFFERDRLITFEKKSKEDRNKALQADELVCVDPCLREELMVDGTMTIAVNGHGELCAIQKGGGLALKTSQILKCAQIAFVKAQEITPLIKKALADDEAQRKLKKLPNYGKPVQPVGYKPSKEDTMEDEESGLSDISEEEEDMDEAFEQDLDDFKNNKNK
jgi:exosome complex component RRP45